MKRIINGKVYNTETATLIGEWSNNRGHGDFSNMSEDLYLTKKGQYFIAGSGGPMTKYAKSCGNNCSTGSDDIYLLTPAEARTWAEEHLSTEEYMEHFEVEEG
jgi:hypothetical protein